MAKFKHKPTEIEAEEWLPGKTVEGVTEMPATIIYSRNKQLYYVSALGESLRSSYWLGVEKVPGSMTDEQRKGSGFFEPGWLEIRKPGEQPYCRSVYPFATFEVSSGEQIPLSECQDSDLWQDYASANKWPNKVPVAYGLLDGSPIGQGTVHPGDWIVIDANGVKSVCKRKEFLENYEPS